MSAPTHPTRRRQQVERAAQEWRSALIDVSGNNRLLFFKSTAATLDLADASPTALAELLAGSAVRLTRLFTDPVRVLAAQRALKKLAGKQREAAEEYGVAVAFCAFGLATWSRTPGDVISETEDQDVDRLTGEVNEEAGAADTLPANARPRWGGARAPTAPAAPVLLRAVELTHPPGSDAWELTLTGEAQLNPVLVHVLAAQGVRLDEEETLDAGDDTRDGLAPIFDLTWVTRSSLISGRPLSRRGRAWTRCKRAGGPWARTPRPTDRDGGPLRRAVAAPAARQWWRGPR